MQKKTKRNTLIKTWEWHELPTEEKDKRTEQLVDIVSKKMAEGYSYRFALRGAILGGIVIPEAIAYYLCQEHQGFRKFKSQLISERYDYRKGGKWRSE